VALRSLGDFRGRAPGQPRPRGPGSWRAFAEAVGVREESDRPLLDGVAASLAGRAVLLLVDNCEHVLAEAARVTDVLLRAAPGLRVLATSQEALGLEGEHVWSAPPLAVPAAGPGRASRPPAHDAVPLRRSRAARDPRSRSRPRTSGAVVRSPGSTGCRSQSSSQPRIRAMSAAPPGRLDDCFQLLTPAPRRRCPPPDAAGGRRLTTTAFRPERTRCSGWPFRGSFDLGRRGHGAGQDLAVRASSITCRVSSRSRWS
jgi:hypothetical protein